MNPLLQGIRVLDLSRLLPGPYCTLTLAQLGAEVIKIEEPQGGDYARAMAPEMFDIVNRGKQSITLDLRDQEDVERLKALVKTADVLIESFRPGVMDKLGCGYETLKAINPKLVYASLTGYGQTGPYAERPGHDLNYLGYAGVLDQTGLSGKRPAMSNVQIADLAGGAQNCTIGILAALMGAQHSGKGCWVDISMLDGALALQSMALATHHRHGTSLPRGQDMLTGALANYNIYHCRDGKYLAVGSLEPKFFTAFLKEITPAFLWPKPKKRAHAMRPYENEQTDNKKQTSSNVGAISNRSHEKQNESSVTGAISNRPHEKANESSVVGAISNRPQSSQPKQDALYKLADNPKKLRRLMLPVRWLIQLVLLTKTRDQWEAKLAHKDTCVSAILSLEEALQNEQVRARKMVSEGIKGPVINAPFRFVGAHTHNGTAPKLGEHNQPVLGSLDISTPTPSH